jgi:carbon monoxide dehydrogenase subunit G
MRIDNEFIVAAPLEQVWNYVLDAERLAPCAPGAELTEVVDERTWKGRLNVKVGPIAMSFGGTVVLQERDDQAHRAVLKAEGREQRGRGGATAFVRARMEPAGDGTKVVLETELSISGAAAQYGRGMLGDISQRMTNEFATCLEEKMNAAASSASVSEPLASTGGPVKGIRLALWATWRAMVRFIRRMFRR